MPAQRVSDPSFDAAIGALQRGDVAALVREIEREPRLMRERVLGLSALEGSGRSGYFNDPKLFWFIANNPRLVDRMAPTMVEVARALIEHGIEREDLERALELVMSGASAREAGLQRELMRTLLAEGARASDAAILAAGAHRELDALRALVEIGYPKNATIAAALGESATLDALLPDLTAPKLHEAFAMAVINGHVDCARIALRAGADASAFFPAGAHAHGTALHHAAANDDVRMIEVLAAHGARLDLRDTTWDGTPLDWAIHEGRANARAALHELYGKT